MAGKELKGAANSARETPGSLRFGIIVTISVFWVQLIRSILTDIFSAFNFSSNILVDLFMALIVTALGLFVLMSYRKMVTLLNK